MNSVSATKTNIWPSFDSDKKNESPFQNSANIFPYLRETKHLNSSKSGALVRVRGVGVRNRNETIQQQILKRQLFFRQYYPEGEWGYIILFCAFLSAIICQGVLWSIGLLSLAAERRFFRRYLPDISQNYAGKLKRVLDENIGKHNMLCTSDGLYKIFVPKYYRFSSG